MQEYKSLAELFPSDNPEDVEARQRMLKSRLEADSTFRTGIVTPVGELFVAIPREMTKKLQNLYQYDGTANAFWYNLPEQTQFSNTQGCVTADIAATYKLEGIEYAPDELADVVDAAFDDASQEGGSFKKKTKVDAKFGSLPQLYAELAVGDGFTFPRKLKEIRAIYDKITPKHNGATDGSDSKLFRTKPLQIELFDGRLVDSAADNEKRIGVLLSTVMSMVKSERLPRIIEAAVVYFAFEYIHPFTQSNGLLSRFLLTLLMSNEIAVPSAFLLVQSIMTSGDIYGEAFARALDPHNCGELTFFVDFILDAINMTHQSLFQGIFDRMAGSDAIDDVVEQLGDQYDLTGTATDLLFGILYDELHDDLAATSLDSALAKMEDSEEDVRDAADELKGYGLITFLTEDPLTMVAVPAIRDRARAAMNTPFDDDFLDGLLQ